MDPQQPKPENDLPIYSEVKDDKNIFHHLSDQAIDMIQTLVVFGAIFSVIYLFVAQPHRVSGKSMFPTFHDSDFILTDKLSYRFHIPQRGDVIVLKNPRNEEQDFIKRIMATPGDTIKVQGGQVYVNNNLVSETYLPDGIYTRAGNFLHEGEAIRVGESQLVVFGDNRGNSSDSRDWGYVKDNEIVGRVFFRYWPPQAFGLKLQNY